MIIHAVEMGGWDVEVVGHDGMGEVTVYPLGRLKATLEWVGVESLDMTPAQARVMGKALISAAAHAEGGE